MSSINAKQVAQDVSESIGTGQKVSLGAIILKNGYSESTSKTPKRVTNTKTYQQAMKPFIEMLEDEISKIQAEMASRDIKDEKYKELAEVLDKLFKNKQLATGGATENQIINIQIDSSLAKRYEINTSSDTNSELPK